MENYAYFILFAAKVNGRNGSNSELIRSKEIPRRTMVTGFASHLSSKKIGIAHEDVKSHWHGKLQARTEPRTTPVVVSLYLLCVVY